MFRSYKWPPITEAVVELRFQQPLTTDLIEKLKGRFAQDFPLPPQTNVNFGVEFNQESTKVSREFGGYKLTSADGAGIVVIGPNAVSTSRLAPYPGWDTFISGAKANWDTWKRVVGKREVIRIGVRYINRIDLPNPDGGPIDVEDYFNFTPRTPRIGELPISEYTMSVSAPLEVDDLRLVINSSSHTNVLVKTNSFILDLDVSREKNVPQRENELWECIDQIRLHKNAVFEACLTDRTRKLFES